MKDILHIDMNAYFATVEEILDPRLVGRPVIVGGRVKRSVVASANYLARAKGVRAAMPVFQAEKLCPEGVYVFPHFHAYEEYHIKFTEYIEKNFTNKIEVASIDECYVDVTDLTSKHSALEIAKQIQDGIKKRFGLGTSIGVAHNKFMAKMGSDYKKPNGITRMYEEDVKTKLWPIKIEDMYFIGRQTAKLLIDAGINTIGDLAKTKNDKAAELLNKNWESYLYMANGGGDDELDLEFHSPKSIGVQNTFLLDTDDFDEIKEMIVQQCGEIFERSKSQGMVGKTINVTIKYPDFSSKQKSYTLDHFVNSCEELLVNAENIYEKMNKSKKIRLIGVSISNLVPDVEELNIFNYDKKVEKKDDSIEDIIESINKKMKKNVVGTAKNIL